MTTSTQTPRRIVLVTGPSGAGRSSAIRSLEDLGFEAIDNMPLRLIGPLLDDPAPDRPIALGIDPRTRDFSVTAVADSLGQIAAMPGTAPELLFLDASTEVLINRFSETRRRHPLAAGDRVEAGIDREKALLEPLKARADVLIDTSKLNVHELRAEVENWFGRADAAQMSVSIQSFSYKRGLPRAVDTIIDCRFLSNPYWEPGLRSPTGLDPRVLAHIRTDPRCEEFERRLQNLALFLLPAYRDEGKSHLSLAFGCTGGQHRSVAMAESLAVALAKEGWQVSIRHRELDRRKKDEAVE